MKTDLIKNTTIVKAAKAGKVSVNELGDYLMQTYPIKTLCTALAEYIMGDDTFEPIPITEEQFRTHFRVLGTKIVDGELVKENRGRKVGTKVVNGKVINNK